MGSGGLHIEIEAFFNIIGLKNVEQAQRRAAADRSRHKSHGIIQY